MGAHIVNGRFQSDKYPTCPPGKVPLSVRDPRAQDVLWIVAQRYKEVDPEFAADLETTLKDAGFDASKRRVIVFGANPVTAELSRVTEALDDLATLDSILPPAPWEADVEDPGTADESFTGKFLHPATHRVGPWTSIMDTPSLARCIATLRNLVHKVVGGP